MASAALDVDAAIRNDDARRHVNDRMQTRDEPYDHPGCHAYEDELDARFGKQA